MEILFYNLNKKKPFGINKIYILYCMGDIGILGNS